MYLTKMVNKMNIVNEYFTYKRLDWDSRNLEMETFELQIKQSLNAESINELKSIWHNAELLYIKNYTKNRMNSKFIGEETSAVIYDTNISFVLDLKNSVQQEVNDNSDFTYVIKSKLDIELSSFINFSESRFVKDVQLNNRIGVKVYSDWITNSFNHEKKKFFVIEKKSEVLGFILYQEHEDSITIELISVNKDNYNQKIGTNLISNFVKSASNKQFHYLYVGTQISNIIAINFYINNQFKVKDTTDIYHWRK